MKYKLVPESKESTYEGGKYQYRLYFLSSGDIDGSWVFDEYVYARSITDAKALVLASLPEKELYFDG